MLGTTYTIVDMAVWGWARLIPTVMGGDALGQVPQRQALLDDINPRPAAPPWSGCSSKYSFKTEWDEEARRHMFPQNAVAAEVKPERVRGRCDATRDVTPLRERAARCRCPLGDRRRRLGVLV